MLVTATAPFNTSGSAVSRPLSIGFTSMMWVWLTRSQMRAMPGAAA
ncbi:hypothetical protein MKAN_03185 [Mycobacterium kansasii ATCC 12478]|uniref:Uncharacterized protein n=1 Tax=Mycobacterium kansasii ATCC 12478 TaxID=557599 RepID=U5X1B3_MYCKA|nr:hypothetical protein MKAN_03185 [Mycobacterium kansasii ATCC 12478]